MSRAAVGSQPVLSGSECDCVWPPAATTQGVLRDIPPETSVLGLLRCSFQLPDAQPRDPVKVTVGFI